MNLAVQQGCGRARYAGLQRGMSLVELMVGITIGLFIVAAATLMVGNQLSDNRRLLLETQLQQDMRATMDIMTRQIRRAGIWSDAYSLTVLATPDGRPGNLAPDPDSANRFVISVGTSNSQILFNYWLNPQDKEAWGFKLEDGSVKTRLSRAGWQELTDGNTMRIIALNIGSVRAGGRGKPKNGDPITLPCPNLCPNGTASCWPKVQLREVVVSITGQSKSDASVTRQLASSIRIRNDIVVFSSAGDVPLNQACPSS